MPPSMKMEPVENLRLGKKVGAAAAATATSAAGYESHSW